MLRLLLLVLVSLLTIIFNQPLNAQTINIPIPNIPSSNIHYNPYSNNISINSNYLYFNKNLGPVIIKNYGYYNSYMPNYYPQSTFIRTQNYYNNLNLPALYTHNPFYRSSIPIGKMGNSRINLDVSNIKSPKLMIYNY
ncbi:MAG: hypothetical protein AB1782_01895 [Cyanobacteriota bacterium]